jgi:hypothetical protein
MAETYRWGIKPGQIIAHLWDVWDYRTTGGGYGAKSACGRRTPASITFVASPTKRCRQCRKALKT